MTISSASRYFLWTGLFLIFAAGVGSVVVRAEEAPLPVDVDVCANVPGEQDTEPCADVQCSADGGTWIGDSCDLPLPPQVDVCANVPGDQDTEPCADVQCSADG